MKKCFCIAAPLSLFALSCASVGNAQSLGSAFSYQGQLKEAGVPASGLYDIQACLFSASSGATSLLLCAPDIPDVPVSAGLFTVALEFGATVFAGQQRYLELRVRPGISTGNYTVLSPRQLLRATPEALRANVASAAPWSGLGGVPTGFADNTDNDSGGTVTSITAGAGLSGGTIIGNGSIAIAASGVNNTMIAADAVGAAQLASNAVDTAAIVDANVTGAKIAPGAVGSAQINTAQVQTRITGSCRDGEFFRGINSDGTLNCELLPVTFDRVLDVAGDVGKYVAVALRSDDRPLIAYHENTAGALKIYDCADPACASGTRRTLDAAGDVGEDIALEIRPNGFPIIAYRDVTAQALKLYDCASAACNTGTARVLDSSVNVGGRSIAMALRADGRAFISYKDASNFSVRAYDCANLNCSTGAVRSLPGDNPDGTSVVIRADGRPLIARGGNAGAASKVSVLDCIDAACLTSTNRVLIPNASRNPVSMVLRGDGRPLIAMTGLGNLQIYDCADTVCSSTTLNPLDSAGASTPSVGLKLRSNGLALIAFGRAIAADDSTVRFFDCSNSGCATGSSRVVLSGGDFGQTFALGLRSDGRPVLAFYDDVNQDLRLHICANPECI